MTAAERPNILSVMTDTMPALRDRARAAGYRAALVGKYASGAGVTFRESVECASQSTRAWTHPVWRNSDTSRFGRGDAGSVCGPGTGDIV